MDLDVAWVWIWLGFGIALTWLGLAWFPFGFACLAYHGLA